MPRIECEAVLLCTNIWSSALSDKIGVPTPLMAFEHQYVITAPIGALSRYDRNNIDHEVTFPATRDVDKTTYFRQHWDSIGVGSYWHEAHMISPHALTDNQTAIHPFTPQDFTKAWRLATELLPDLHGPSLRSSSMVYLPSRSMATPLWASHPSRDSGWRLLPGLRTPAA